jgi:transposase
MYFRIAKHNTKTKVYRHLQLAESFRDPEKGNSPRTRILYNFGSIEEMGEEQLRRMAEGLMKIAGKDSLEPQLLSAKDFGHYYMTLAIWKKLGIGQALQKAGIDNNSSSGFGDMVRWMAINRLCEPGSKLAILDWADSIHAEDKEKLCYHKLLRAMDRLINIKNVAEPLVAKRFLPTDEPVDMVFYDITSTYFEGDNSLIDNDIRRYGYSRDHRDDRRQIVIGMVVTRSGMPICHHVFPGNTADKSTVKLIISDLKERFNLSRLVFIGDRGMLSNANLECILDENLDFIVAHTLRGNKIAEEVISALHEQINPELEEEQFFEDKRNDLRFVMAFSPDMAKEIKKNRQCRLDKADAWISSVLKKTKRAGPGRKCTPQRLYDRVRDYLRERNLLKFYTIGLHEGEVTVKKNRKTLDWEEKIDGVLLLESTDMTMPPQEIVKQYKGLAEIEGGWRSLKSSLILRPVYHWTERRIRAHVFICVLALQLERYIRNKLKTISVSKAIRLLRQIKMAEFSLGASSYFTPTKLTDEQKALLQQLEVPVPKGKSASVEAL